MITDLCDTLAVSIARHRAIHACGQILFAAYGAFDGDRYPSAWFTQPEGGDRLEHCPACGAALVTGEFVSELEMLRRMAHDKPGSHASGRGGLPRETRAAMYFFYQERGLGKTAAMFGRTRQTMHEILARFTPGHPNRTQRHEVIIHNGRRFTPGKDGYQRETNERRELLHHVIWREHFGQIPRAHQIAFKDGDVLNCAVENLECIPFAGMGARGRYKHKIQRAGGKAA